MHSIKTHAPERQEADGEQWRFYVLSRGCNAGRPSRTPHANSFEVATASKEEAERLFWTAYALWQSKALRPLLKGSVILFISIKDYKRAFEEAERRAENIGKFAPQLEAAQQGIENAKNRIKLFEQMKVILSREALKSK